VSVASPPPSDSPSFADRLFSYGSSRHRPFPPLQPHVGYVASLHTAPSTIVAFYGQGCKSSRSSFREPRVQAVLV
ncbi:hypothetical protein Csa_015967, partial [Cucumis sativus]